LGLAPFYFLKTNFSNQNFVGFLINEKKFYLNRKNGRNPKQPVSKRLEMKFKNPIWPAPTPPETKTAKIHNAYIRPVSKRELKNIIAL
jgi:hypothetical protein